MYRPPTAQPSANWRNQAGERVGNQMIRRVIALSTARVRSRVSIRSAALDRPKYLPQQAVCCSMVSAGTPVPDQPACESWCSAT
jgi:hypothetical protein